MPALKSPIQMLVGLGRWIDAEATIGSKPIADKVKGSHHPTPIPRLFYIYNMYSVQTEWWCQQLLGDSSALVDHLTLDFDLCCSSDMRKQNSARTYCTALPALLLMHGMVIKSVGVALRPKHPCMYIQSLSSEADLIL